MNIKTVIKISLSIVFVILSLFFLIIFQMPEMEKAKNEEAKKILEKINSDITTYNSVQEKTLNSISKDFFYAVWVQEKSRDWLPVCYNKKYLIEKELISPFIKPYKISRSYQLYPEITPFKIRDNQYYIWINKYNLDYFLNYIVLALLFLIFIYLIFMIVIELIFIEKIENAPVQKYSDEENSIYNKNDFDDIISSYKELWQKNFKISDDFKNNFPFDKISNLVKFGAIPSSYLKDALEFAQDFFGWNNPKIYIIQNDNIIDGVTKEILDKSKIKLPLDGNQKGDIFIPLFPYSVNNIYGYLFFEWNKEYKFKISDILYFLKFLFSEKAKQIFTNYKEMDRIIEILESKINNNAEIGFAVIEADNKENIINELKNDNIEKLNHEIKERLIDEFNREMIFEVNDLLFCIITENINKNEFAGKIEKWIKNVDLQFYNVSNEYGNIALTYSGGISFKSGRNLHPLTLINEAGLNLEKAIEKGKNGIVY